MCVYIYKYIIIYAFICIWISIDNSVEIQSTKVINFSHVSNKQSCGSVKYCTPFAPVTNPLSDVPAAAAERFVVVRRNVIDGFNLQSSVDSRLLTS